MFLITLTNQLHIFELHVLLSIMFLIAQIPFRPSLFVSHVMGLQAYANLQNSMHIMDS